MFQNNIVQIMFQNDYLIQDFLEILLKYFKNSHGLILIKVNIDVVCNDKYDILYLKTLRY